MWTRSRFAQYEVEGMVRERVDNALREAQEARLCQSVCRARGENRWEKIIFFATLALVLLLASCAQPAARPGLAAVPPTDDLEVSIKGLSVAAKPNLDWADVQLKDATGPAQEKERARYGAQGSDPRRNALRLPDDAYVGRGVLQLFRYIHRHLPAFDCRSGTAKE